ncbi:28 kDa heat- and acid-stable phosphoprotein-like [Lycorma delicatula]|uniref:28 kDa heat- and acid-stable phosphoprotein-like n=1 Tax=Lycorma delicatula TaxID=130591 RepID=UPI003F5149A4
MPKGRFLNHKGKNRRFTNPEELEEQRRREEKERQWRQERGEESSSEEEEAGDKEKNKSSSSDSESESEEEEEHVKAKGVENLIEVENPNRVQKKTKKLSSLNENLQSAKPELSRKEREELERQRATAHYQKMHAEGKTEEARADLARLAIIKQQRAEAARLREEEKKQKELAKQAKTAQTQKALVVLHYLVIYLHLIHL